MDFAILVIYKKDLNDFQDGFYKPYKNFSTFTLSSVDP